MRSPYSRQMMRRLMAAAALVFSLLAAAACVGRETAPIDAAQASGVVSPLSPMPGRIYSETGIASWYGKELHGKKTASGEVFDKEGISAAHRTLSLGTRARITNLDNAKSIKVRITDRGPFIKSRMLSVSYGAAKELDFVGQGTARVALETLDEVTDAGRYTVQAALYTEEENAKILRRRLAKKFELVFIVPFETNITRYFSIRVGAYASYERAEQTAGKLALEGLEPIVLRKD